MTNNKNNKRIFGLNAASSAVAVSAVSVAILMGLSGCGKQDEAKAPDTAASAAAISASAASSPESSSHASGENMFDPSVDDRPNLLWSAGGMTGVTPEYRAMVEASREKNRVKEPNATFDSSNPDAVAQMYRDLAAAEKSGIPTSKVPLIRIDSDGKPPQPAIDSREVKSHAWSLMTPTYDEYLDINNVWVVGHDGGRMGNATRVRGVVLLRDAGMFRTEGMTYLWDWLPKTDKTLSHVKVMFDATCDAREHDMRILRAEAFDVEEEMIAGKDLGDDVYRFITSSDEDEEASQVNWVMNVCMTKDIQEAGIPVNIKHPEATLPLGVDEIEKLHGNQGSDKPGISADAGTRQLQT